MESYQKRSGQIVDVTNNYYNYQGIRYKKIVKQTISKKLQNYKVVNYYLDGDKIIGEDWLYLEGDTKELRYFYDTEGISGIRYDGYNFNLIRDALGNISKVMYRGKIIGEYIYDAWGNCTVVDLSPIDSDGNSNNNDRDRFVLNNNPFRYKGYYYDVETGLFYCNSRYYSPELCRWISPDSIEYLDPNSINGLNLYAYCGNDPINKYDPSGHFAISLTMLGLIIGAAIGATAGGIAAYNIAKNHGAEGWELFGWTMADIVGGGVIGGALGARVGALVTKVTGVIGLSITKYSIIPIKGTTILGHMPGYIGAAQTTGAGYYLVSNGTYDKMVQKVVEWTNNMSYLKDANSLGSRFVLVPDFVVREGGTFWKEIQYLIENGIPWEMF